VWTVSKPAADAVETYKTCISKVKNIDLRTRLRAIEEDVGDAAEEYGAHAEIATLHEIQAAEMVGNVTADEMMAVYDQRMAAKNSPGRPIYDHIKMLPAGDRCPYCDQRNVSTLDHVLPKSLYPALAVTPVNLVGACMECNKTKKSIEPLIASDVVLHPYFDDVTGVPWLKANVIEQTPCAVVFHVEHPADWAPGMQQRVNNHFALFGLNQLYSAEAARELANVRFNLQKHFEAGGADAVREELIRQRDSRLANRLNAWQSAFYEALAGSEWFYSGGFALG
jgi:5-methylcytosine-specific restriction endonuclease McrA